MTDAIERGLFIPNWSLPKGVEARFSGRRFDVAPFNDVSKPPYDEFNLGLHVGDDPQAVHANRTQLLASLPGAKHIQWLEQVHGTEVVEASNEPFCATADACTSNRAGVACAVMTADCLPVLFCDVSGERVAAAHAGWRGLANGVLLRTLAQFDRPADVLVFLGPAIGPTAFEVGPEVRLAFAWATDDCFSTGHGDRYFADIYAIARQQLMTAGVQNIEGGDHCTFLEREQFFSYRRDGVTGRQVSLIWKSSDATSDLPL
ncbi:MAG: peptidoglycan editing factor PgeF [Oleibacter sp.]|nr:peptidoglycan editing factor PgeF [Thalassolituus sp.]